MRNADEAAHFLVQGTSPHRIIQDSDDDVAGLLDNSFQKEQNINIEVQTQSHQNVGMGKTFQHPSVRKPNEPNQINHTSVGQRSDRYTPLNKSKSTAILPEVLGSGLGQRAPVLKNKFYEEETLYNIDAYSGRKKDPTKKTKTQFPNISAKVPLAAQSISHSTNTSEVGLNERLAKLSTQHSERLKVLEKRGSTKRHIHKSSYDLRQQFFAKEQQSLQTSINEEVGELDESKYMQIPINRRADVSFLKDNISAANIGGIHGISPDKNSPRNLETSGMSANGRRTTNTSLNSIKQQKFLYQGSVDNLLRNEKVTYSPQNKNRGATTLVTSGNSKQDEYLQVALGVRSMGKTLIPLPKSINELEKMGKNYLQSMDQHSHSAATDRYIKYVTQAVKNSSLDDEEYDSEDNNIELSDDEAKVKEVETGQDVTTKGMQALKSAQIKSLQRINRDASSSAERERSASQRLLGRNMEKMNASEIQSVSKGNDKIQIGPKTLKVVNQAIVNQFGPTAFNMKNAGSPKRHRSQLKTQNRATFQKTESLGKKLLVSKNELVTSLNQHGNSIKPSITTKALENSDEKKVGWLKDDVPKEFENINMASLGKPSNRHDAIVLAQWYTDIMTMIHNEGSREGKPSECQPLIHAQLVHNIVIKELTRQVSVYCIERGILLKTVFDSYIRLIDLVFGDQFEHDYKNAKNTANQVKQILSGHRLKILKKNVILRERAKLISELQATVAEYESRDANQKSTIEKLRKKFVDVRKQYDNEAFMNKNFQKEIASLNDKLEKMKEALEDASKSGQPNEAYLQKRLDLLMKKQFVAERRETEIEDKSHDAEFKNGSLIEDTDVATDMTGHREYLEKYVYFDKLTKNKKAGISKGDPIYQEFASKKFQTDTLTLDEKEELELVRTIGTTVNDQWRKETRAEYQDITGQNIDGSQEFKPSQDSQGEEIKTSKFNTRKQDEPTPTWINFWPEVYTCSLNYQWKGKMMPDRDTKTDMPVGPIQHRRRRNSFAFEPYYRLGNLEIEDNTEYVVREIDANKKPRTKGYRPKSARATFVIPQNTKKKKPVVKKRKAVSKEKKESGLLPKGHLMTKLETKLSRALTAKVYEEMLIRRFKKNFTEKQFKDMEKRIPQQLQNAQNLVKNVQDVKLSQIVGELQKLVQKKDIISKLTKKHGKNFRTKLLKPQKVVKNKTPNIDQSSKESSRVSPSKVPEDGSAEGKFTNITISSAYRDKAAQSSLESKQDTPKGPSMPSRDEKEPDIVFSKTKKINLNSARVSDHGNQFLEAADKIDENSARSMSSRYSLSRDVESKSSDKEKQYGARSLVGKQGSDGRNIGSAQVVQAEKKFGKHLRQDPNKSVERADSPRHTSIEPIQDRALGKSKKEHAVNILLRKQKEKLELYVKKNKAIPVKDLMTRKALTVIIYKTYEENAKKLMEGGHLQQNIAENKLAMLQGNLSPRQKSVESSPERFGSGEIPTGLTKSLFTKNYSKNWHADLFDPDTWILLESVYDQFLQKHGSVGNIGERKTTQVVNACSYFQTDSFRIRLFSRFCKITDPYLSLDEFRRYMDTVEWMYKNVPNFSIDEKDDQIWIPYQYIVQNFKNTAHAQLAPQAIQNCMKLIDRMKVNCSKMEALHLRTHHEAIDLDEYCEFILDTGKSIKIEKMQNLKDLFKAADMDNRGLLNFSDLEMLYQVMHSTSYTSNKEARKKIDLRRVFDQFAQTPNELLQEGRLTEDDAQRLGEEKYLKYSTFESMCLSNQLFSTKEQSKFMLNLFNAFFAEENEKEQEHNFNVDLIHLRHNLSDAINRLKSAVNEFKVGYTEDDQQTLSNIAELIDQESAGVSTLQNLSRGTPIMGDQNADITIKEEKTRLFSETDRLKYLEMIQVMHEAVKKESTGSKVAILTFKVVEETIKRAYMKAHLNNLMPAQALTTQKWIRYTEKIKRQSQQRQRQSTRQSTRESSPPKQNAENPMTNKKISKKKITELTVKEETNIIQIQNQQKQSVEKNPRPVKKEQPKIRVPEETQQYQRPSKVSEIKGAEPRADFKDPQTVSPTTGRQIEKQQQKAKTNAFPRLTHMVGAQFFVPQYFLDSSAPGQTQATNFKTKSQKPSLSDRLALGLLNKIERKIKQTEQRKKE